MKYKIFLAWFIWVLCTVCAIAQSPSQQITAYQYYFDTDPGVGIAGNGNVATITSTSNFSQTINISVAGLATGFHTLFVRVKDNQNVWSIAERSLFYVNDATISNSINAYQYFYDTDPGVGINGNGDVVSVTQTTTLNQTLNLNLTSAGLSTGFHQLFIRTRNTDGVWSVAERSLFYINDLSLTNSINAYQYFFDNDPGVGINGNGAVVGVAQSTTFNQTLNINLSGTGLSSGFHQLFIRTRNTDGKWSIAERSVFYINENNNTQTVTALEYYFDNDPGVGLANSYPVTTTSNLNITANLVAPCLSAGNHFLFLRAKDEFGKWSIIEKDTIAVTSGVNAFNVTPAGPLNVCSGNTVTLSTTNTPGISYQWLLNGSPISGATTISYVVSASGSYSIKTTCGAAFATSNVVVVNVQPLSTYYLDNDGDGFGDVSSTTQACSQPTGYVSNNTDCDDNNINIHAPITYYVDSDHDNFGSTTTASLCVLTPPVGYSTNNTDCDDNNINIHAPVIYYADADGDGYGSNVTGSFCQLTPPSGYVTNNTDCNDGSALEHPGQVWYIDNDADGYGTGTSVTQCIRPSHGYVLTELTSTTGDCNDANGAVHPGATEVCNGIDDNCNGSIDEGVKLTFYQDADGDTYGNSSITQLACTPPTGYVANNTDCNDASAIEHPGQVWYIDNDGDGYGRNGAAVTQCLRPLHGFIATELIATTGDCNDNNASINPGSRYFTFTGNSNFTNSIINPQIGTSYTTFHVEADYFDAGNALPAVNYPRLQMDYEGNGIFTDANDRIYLMSQNDPSDVSTSNGKRYSIDINGLPTGTNWTARIFTNDAGCATNFGPFNNPDVYELPNLVIFANDINITPVHPNPSDNITVSATVHNPSDYDAVNFYVHLTNQYDSINFTYPNILVSNLPAHTATTVTWTIVTPPVAAFVPMEVRIDETNVISETNELDNRAIRPYVNGNYNLPGGIVCDAQVTPFASNSAASNFPVISGNVHYYGLAVPLQDSSVAGATVSFTIVETGITFTGYTGSNGFYSIPFPGPIDTGLYHVNVAITDYTLTGFCNTTFRILPCINLPDLTASVSLGYTNGIPGNSFSGSITVTNSGCAPVGPSILGITQSGGTPTLSNINVGALLAGQSQTFTFGPITVANPGSFSICAFADATFAIAEGNETNNSSCPASYSYGSGGGGGGGGGGFGNLGSFGFGGGGSYACNANNFTIALRNSGTAAVGSFTVQVLISKNGVLQNTLTQVVSGIPALTNTYVTFPYNYTAVGSGNYTYEVNTDLYNTVVESDEGNNISFYSNTLLPCKPNLTFIECDSITVTPANVTTAGTLTLTSTVLNNGSAAAIGPIAVRFNYSNGGVYTAQYNGNIAINTAAPVSVSAPVPPIGTTVFATIDPLAQISEESEGDNLSPTWNMCYDFRIDTLCGAKSNMWEENYNLFETLNLRAGLSNLGLLQADTVKVRFQISGPGIIGTINLGDAIVTNVGRTCKCPLQAYLPDGYVFTLNGLYTVTVTADPDNHYSECSEGNNVMVSHIQVSDLPEYRILSQYINPSLLNPDVGQPVTFDVTYENVGKEDLNDSMRFNFLADNIQLNSIYPVSGLPKNAHATLPLSSWSSNVPGIHILRAVIDADSTVDESNELNNEGTRSIVVGQSANLYFQVFQPSTLTPSLYQNLSITTRIGNSGDLPCEADVQYYYINGNDTLPISALQHVSVPANDSVDLSLFNWTVISTSTKLVGKIINSASLEYTYDDNITSVKIGSFGLAITTTPETCPGAANGTATVVASAGVAPYSYLWSSSSGSAGAGPILTATAGSYTVTVTDNSGQSVSGTTTITTTADHTNPVFANCPTNSTQCDTIVTWTPPTATDNCGTAAITSNYSPGHAFALGNTTVIYTANDGHGNTSTCSFTVTITSPPIWYLDKDGDHYYTGAGVPKCSSPGAGYTTTGILGGGDCNDTLATVHPGAPEICFNGIDDNCNGQIDENCCVSSVAATSITSDANNNEICAGNNVVLTLHGGSLGSNANWKWYKNACGTIAIGTGTTITLTPPSTTTYFVRAEGCDTTSCIAITIKVSSSPVTALPLMPFTGMPSSVCAGTVATLSITVVNRATYYVWDAPTGSYFNGVATNVSPFTTTTPSVQVTFGSPSGSLYNVGVQAGNTCGSSVRQSQKVRGLTSVPASVSGPLTACAGSVVNYSTAAVTGATSYLWTITGNATVSGTGTTATVTFGTGWTGGSLCVAAQTTCYTSPTKCITISTSASTLNAISGTFTACPNSTLTYSVPASTGAASYTWTLPPGSTGSSTTNSIAVAYGTAYNAAGNICVSVTSICGVTSANKCKTVAPGLPSQPSGISGPLNGLCNQTVAYNTSSQGAGVTYSWTSPGTISNGQGTTSISTTFGALSTGNVCVTANNTCGSSTARCVPVKGAPNSPGAIAATPPNWCANTQGIEFDVNTSALTGTYALSWLFPPAAVATYVFGGGNSTSLILDWKAGSGNVNVTAYNACGSGTKTSTWSSTCREGESGTLSSMTISPNPTTGIVNVSYTATKGNTVINVLDLAGRVVITQATSSVDGANTTQLDISKLAKGAYMLNVQSTQGGRQIKVVVE